VAYPFFRELCAIPQPSRDERVGPLFLFSPSFLSPTVDCQLLTIGFQSRRRAPAQTTPKTILPPIPFSALTHPPVISTGMDDSSRFSLRRLPTRPQPVGHPPLEWPNLSVRGVD
jgi:hypothetical protein